MPITKTPTHFEKEGNIVKEVFTFKGDLRQLTEVSMQSIAQVVPSFEKVAMQVMYTGDVPRVPVDATYEATESTYSAHTIIEGFDIKVTMPWDKVVGLMYNLKQTVLTNDDLDPDYAGNVTDMIDEFCKVDPRAFIKAMHNVPTPIAKGV